MFQTWIWSCDSFIIFLGINQKWLKLSNQAHQSPCCHAVWKFNSLIPSALDLISFLAAWLYHYAGGASHHKLRMLSQGCNPPLSLSLSLSLPAAGTHSCAVIRERDLIWGWRFILVRDLADSSRRIYRECLSDGSESSFYKLSREEKEVSVGHKLSNLGNVRFCKPKWYWD